MCGLAGLLFCVVVRTLRSTGGSITFYRPPCNLASMIFRKISKDCKYPAFFLWFAAGIADSRDMTKQPIMIRVVVVCPVTGVYRVTWVPLCAPTLETLSTCGTFRSASQALHWPDRTLQPADQVELCMCFFGLAGLVCQPLRVCHRSCDHQRSAAVFNFHFKQGVKACVSLVVCHESFNMKLSSDRWVTIHSRK